METGEAAPPTDPTSLPLPKPPQRIVYWITGVSLGLGFAGDCLLRVTPWGINATIFAGLVVAGIAWGWRRHRESKPCWDLLVLVGVFGLCPTWRDASVLRGMNLMTIIILLVVLTTRPTHRQLYSGRLGSMLANLVQGTGQALCSPIILLARDIDWALARVPLSSTHRRILRALILALPFLLVFTCLFSAADAVFQHGIKTAVTTTYDFVIASNALARHILFILLFFNLAIMVLRPITLREKFKPYHTEPPAVLVPGAVELSVVMGSILALFLVFIIIQFRYLFGGHQLVQTITGLTYAAYARKGFFALLAVVALVHLLLMMGAWLVERSHPRTQTLFRRLSLGLIGLTGFVCASAIFRMSVYIEAYGLTQLRFYAMAILMWLGLVLLLSTAKHLFPRLSCFTGAYLYSFLGILLLTNLMNPDARIARTNLDRFVAQGELDHRYLQELSTDAIPVITQYEGQLSPGDSQFLVKQIIETRMADKTDWRCWNYSRAQAGQLYDRSQTRNHQHPPNINRTKERTHSQILTDQKYLTQVSAKSVE